LTGVMHAATEAWYCLILGSAAAVPALATGWFEYTRLDERLVNLGSRHMILMCIVWMLYLAALFSRTQHRVLAENSGFTTYVLSTIGFFTMIVGGWHGGHLVYQFGAGSVADSRH